MWAGGSGEQTSAQGCAGSPHRVQGLVCWTSCVHLQQLAPPSTPRQRARHVGESLHTARAAVCARGWGGAAITPMRCCLCCCCARHRGGGKAEGGAKLAPHAARPDARRRPRPLPAPQDPPERKPDPNGRFAFVEHMPEQAHADADFQKAVQDVSALWGSGVGLANVPAPCTHLPCPPPPLLHPPTHPPARPPTCAHTHADSGPDVGRARLAVCQGRV